jgi:outer membrane immunogenic protein
MRRFLAASFTAALTLGLAGAAMADDSATYGGDASWAGFNLGVNMGGAWDDFSRSYRMPFTAPGNIFANCRSPSGAAAVHPTNHQYGVSRDCSQSSSIIGGAQFGYNWQMDSWVFGIEADGAGQDLLRHSYTRFGANLTAGSPMGSVPNDTAYFQEEMTGLVTVRGRLGYSGGPWLIYATGGLAFGQVEHKFTEVLSPGNGCVPGTLCRTTRNDSTKTGWTLGGGLSWMFAPRWSIGAEYLCRSRLLDDAADDTRHILYERQHGAVRSS